MKEIEVQKIPLEDAYARFQKGTPLVDVREYDEISALAYALPEVIVMPLSELETRFSELPKDKTLITACKAGGRSLKAAQFLASKGYEKILSMDVGMVEWAKKGFPVLSGTVGQENGMKSEDTECSCCCDSTDGSSCC